MRYAGVRFRTGLRKNLLPSLHTHLVKTHHISVARRTHTHTPRESSCLIQLHHRHAAAHDGRVSTWTASVFDKCLVSGAAELRTSVFDLTAFLPGRSTYTIPYIVACVSATEGIPFTVNYTRKHQTRPAEAGGLGEVVNG